MNIKIWTDFSKKKNSTKQPTGGTSKTAHLKENTSIENPVFILEGGMLDVVYVQAMNHFYFVTDIISIANNLTEIHCTQDVLATYKSDILGYTAFVERSQNNYDSKLVDDMVSVEQDISEISNTLSPITLAFGAGCFVVQVLNKSSGLNLYLSNDLTIYNRILTPSAYGASDILDWIDSKISQAFDLDVYIGSVKWFPFDITNLPHATSVSSLVVGPVNLGSLPVGYVLKSFPQGEILTQTTVISLPTGYGDFRDSSPRYTRYKLRLIGVGLVDIDSTVIGGLLHNNGTLSDIMEIDVVSGAITHKIQASIGTNTVQVARYKGNISVNVPIAKSSADVGKSVSLLTGGISSGAVAGSALLGKALQSNAAGAVIGGLAGGITGTVGAIMNDLTPDTTMIGGDGNKTELYIDSAAISLYRYRYKTKDFATNIAGRPCMKNILLSTLTGYVKCGNASVPISGRDSDRDEINAYLNSGFYIE